jgi:Flp pilus assembly protein TadG
MKLFRNEEGQTLVLTAVCASGLIGFMALALDVGVLFHTRREIQTAADAAAVAGAADYLYKQSVSSARTAACAAAATNGFTGSCTTSTSGVCSGSGTVICVNIPPQSGPNTSATGTFVEAVVAQPTTTIFRSGSFAVNARAVAATPTNGQACIWLMNPSGNDLAVQGKYDIESPNCGIYVNSDTTDAMSVTGGAGTINAPFVDVVGNASLQHVPNGVTPTMNSGVRKSPWGNLTGPTSSNCQGGNTVSGNSITSSTTIPSPISGVVCFSGSSPSISGTVTLPGSASGTVYYFENGVSIGVGATVTFGSGPAYNVNTNSFASSPATVGAVLDVGSGTLNQGSNSLLNVYSPTAGSYNGIAIFQPSTNTTQLQVQFGSNNEVMDGYIYAPGAQVYLQDHGGGVTAVGLVAGQLYDKASTFTVPHSYDQANPTTTLNRVLTLVE